MPEEEKAAAQGNRTPGGRRSQRERDVRVGGGGRWLREGVGKERVRKDIYSLGFSGGPIWAETQYGLNFYTI
jgi:hypothetical protein